MFRQLGFPRNGLSNNFFYQSYYPSLENLGGELF